MEGFINFKFRSFTMKSFIVACVLGLVSCTATAGECPCKTATEAVVTKTVEVTTTAVTVPVRAVVGVRARVAARRTARRAAACAAASCGK